MRVTRSFSDDFKRQIVELIVSGSTTQAEISREYYKISPLIINSGKRNTEEFIHHSDQGTQYCYSDYTQIIEVTWYFSNNVLGKANSYDNAKIESFFRTLKVEEASNKKRLYSSLGYLCSWNKFAHIITDKRKENDFHQLVLNQLTWCPTFVVHINR